jgi:hypothetical protein
MHHSAHWHGQVGPSRRAAVRKIARLPMAARLALRVAGVAALAAGGVVVGRGVVSFTTERSHPVEAAVASAAGPAPVMAEPAAALAAPIAAPPAAFTSALRSWAAPPATGAGPAQTPTQAAAPAGAGTAAVPPVEDSVAALVKGPALAEEQTTTAPTSPPPVQLPKTPAAAITVGAATPDAAVRSFYAYLERGQFDQALGLWTARMRSAYPPAENIYSRFSRTQSLTVRRAEVVALDAVNGRATVALDLGEVVGPPSVSRTYVGSWYLVRGPDGWLLDQPSLRTG